MFHISIAGPSVICAVLPRRGVHGSTQEQITGHLGGSRKCMSIVDPDAEPDRTEDSEVKYPAAAAHIKVAISCKNFNKQRIRLSSVNLRARFAIALGEVRGSKRRDVGRWSSVTAEDTQVRGWLLLSESEVESLIISKDHLLDCVSRVDRTYTYIRAKSDREAIKQENKEPKGEETDKRRL